MYEFNGRRGLPTLLAFARGGYRAGAAHMMVPAEILPDASIYWLLAEAMWPAVKQVCARAPQPTTATRHSLLSPRHLPPTTYHLPPTTYDRPPTTDYSLREAVLQAVMYSLGLVLGLKAIIKVLLWCLRGRGGGQDEAGGDKAEAREKAE